MTSCKCLPSECLIHWDGNNEGGLLLLTAGNRPFTHCSHSDGDFAPPSNSFSPPEVETESEKGSNPPRAIKKSREEKPQRWAEENFFRIFSPRACLRRRRHARGPKQVEGEFTGEQGGALFLKFCTCSPPFSHFQRRRARERSSLRSLASSQRRRRRRRRPRRERGESREHTPSRFPPRSPPSRLLSPSWLSSVQFSAAKSPSQLRSLGERGGKYAPAESAQSLANLRNVE